MSYTWQKSLLVLLALALGPAFAQANPVLPDPGATLVPVHTTKHKHLWGKLSS